MAEISPLRRRMIEDMTVRNLSPATQRSYLAAVSKLSPRGCVDQKKAEPLCQQPQSDKRLHKGMSLGSHRRWFSFAVGPAAIAVASRI